MTKPLFQIILYVLYKEAFDCIIYRYILFGGSRMVVKKIHIQEYPSIDLDIIDI